MKRYALSFMILLSSLAPAYSQQVNQFLVPERANARINASVEIAKQLKHMKYNRIAVVYMETSDLCALFAASLVASLRTLGVEAYYVKGGDGLEDRLRFLQPAYIYMAYFGERPHQEVQSQFNQDMKRVLMYEKKPRLILQPSLLNLGFVSGLVVDDELSQALQGLPMLSFVFEGGKPRPARVVLEGFDIKVSTEEPKPKTQRKSSKPKR